MSVNAVLVGGGGERVACISDGPDFCPCLSVTY